MRFNYLSTQWLQCTDAQFYRTRTVRCKASSWKFATFLKQLYCASRVNDVTSEEVIPKVQQYIVFPPHQKLTIGLQSMNKGEENRLQEILVASIMEQRLPGTAQVFPKNWHGCCELLIGEVRDGGCPLLGQPMGSCSRVKPRYWRLSPPPQTERASVVWESWVEQWTHPISTSEACILPSQLTRSCCLKSCIVPQHT